MQQIFYLSFEYLFLNIIFLSSCLGYGRLITNNIIKFNNIYDLKNIDFIFGLISAGVISIFVNFFVPLSDYFSLTIIIIGLIIYASNFYRKLVYLKEISFLLIIFLISYCFSFYAGINDDFGYHFKAIKNFKEYNLFEIEHNRRTSYNSHWLFLNSIFYFSNFKSSLFVITSLIFSITIYDLLRLYKKLFNQEKYFLSFYTFFVLIFLLGVLSKYKEYGTDFIGAILCIYIFIFIIEIIEKQKRDYFIDFIIIVIFSNFAFVIKITNSLIYFMVFLLFLNLKNKFRLFKYLIFLLIPVFLWIYQNLNLSGCIIWPISFLCFDNLEMAKREYYLIESFAKGDIFTSIDLGSLNWIIVWLKNHLNKIVEIYLVYLLILFLPIIYFKIIYKINFYPFFWNFLSENNYKRLFYYFIPILAFNVIWFFVAPSYRFGIFYNLTAIILFLIPFWIKIFHFNKNISKKLINFILFISLLFFIYNNFSRINWYFERYDNIWPPIVKNELVLF